MLKDLEIIRTYLTPDALECPEVRMPIVNTDVEVGLYRNGGGLVLTVIKDDVTVYKCILRNVFDHFIPSMLAPENAKEDSFIIRSIGQANTQLLEHKKDTGID